MLKILLDENRPEQLIKLLRNDFDIQSVYEMQWDTLENLSEDEKVTIVDLRPKP